MKKIENSYKKSGVNISLANKLVKHISNISKKDVKKTKVSKNKDVIGGFGSLFDISNINISQQISKYKSTPDHESQMRFLIQKSDKSFKIVN